MKDCPMTDLRGACGPALVGLQNPKPRWYPFRNTSKPIFWGQLFLTQEANVWVPPNFILNLIPSGVVLKVGALRR